MGGVEESEKGSGGQQQLEAGTAEGGGEGYGESHDSG